MDSNTNVQFNEMQNNTCNNNIIISIIMRKIIMDKEHTHMSTGKRHLEHNFPLIQYLFLLAIIRMFSTLIVHLSIFRENDCRIVAYLFRSISHLKPQRIEYTHAHTNYRLVIKSTLATSDIFAYPDMLIFSTPVWNFSSSLSATPYNVKSHNRAKYNTACTASVCEKRVLDETKHRVLIYSLPSRTTILRQPPSRTHSRFLLLPSWYKGT